MTEGDLILKLKRTYSWTGPLYDVLDFPWEYFRYRKLRPEIWEQVRGVKRILDAGVGTGRNMKFYPADACVTGIDLSESMLASSLRRRVETRANVDLACGTVTALPFKDGTFDAIVATFLFCVLPDALQPAALAEIRRVLKPGGNAILLEYVFSQNAFKRLSMRAFAPIVEFLYGARFDRRTVDHLKAGGWRIESERFLHQDILKLIVARV